jgi:hypothetical protein
MKSSEKGPNRDQNQVEPMKSSEKGPKRDQNQVGPMKSSTIKKGPKRDQNEQVGPMKSSMREIKNLLPSKGFQSNQQNSS